MAAASYIWIETHIILLLFLLFMDWKLKTVSSLVGQSIFINSRQRPSTTSTQPNASQPHIMSNDTKILPLPRPTDEPDRESKETTSIEIATTSNVSSTDPEKSEKWEHNSESFLSQTDHEVGALGGAQQSGIVAGMHKKFRSAKTFGSRMIGGKEPKNWDKYSAYESTSYITPDTIVQERLFLRMTPKKAGHKRLMLWFRYALTGAMVSCCIYAAMKICGIIEYARVKQTTKYLNKGDLTSAWLFWVGTSLSMTTFACFLVLLQPAAASSGIPGLIAFLNGIKPSGGQSPITKIKTSWTSLQTMGAKFVGMLTSIPSGLCIGPEGVRDYCCFHVVVCTCLCD